MRALAALMLISLAGGCLGGWYTPSPEDVLLSDDGVALNDAGKCEKVTDTPLRDACYLGVGRNLADVGTCDRIDSVGVRNSCYRDVAYALRDPSLCAGIKDPGNTQDPGWMERSCVEKMAASIGNASVCGMLDDEKQRIECERKAGQG